MSRKAVLAAVLAAVALLTAGTYFTSRRIDPQHPTAAEPTPGSETPARPTDPTAPGNSPVR